VAVTRAMNLALDNDAVAVVAVVAVDSLVAYYYRMVAVKLT
jgi:hypothetical protein